MADTEPNVADDRGQRAVGLHLRVGWWALLVFLCLGILLEALHGFKVRFYLDVSNETRRLLWTLAHAHGVLLGLVNLAFAFSLQALPGLDARAREMASKCLLGATVLLPAGFFLGGVVVYSGDPGLGIALVPVGAALLLVGIYRFARAVGAATRAASD